MSSTETAVAPSTTKKVLRKKKVTVELVAESEPVVTEPEPVVEAEATSSETEVNISLSDKIKNVMTVVDEELQQLKKLKVVLKDILTSYHKEQKKTRRKDRSKKDNSKYVPHGFTKPTKISATLASFLGVNEAELVASPHVTKVISEYVKANNLADPNDGSIFNVDVKLKKLLGNPVHLVKPKKPELGMGYSYQNLQTYLSPHFMRTVKAK